MTDMRHATSSGTRLAVDVRGSGPATLFIHAYPLNRAIWAHQVAGLDGWRRIAPDLRGMGESDAPDTGYSMATYASDLTSLLDALGIERAVLCGLSMGGYVAFEFLRRWPTRVAGLVLMDTRAGGDTAEGREGRLAAAALAREAGAGAIADTMLPTLLGAATWRTAPEVVERVRSIIAATPVAGIVGALEAMRERPDSTPLLATIAVPTLVVVGEDDQITPPAGARAMAAAIPGAQLAIVPEAGHLPPVERPEVTTDIIRRFLNSLPGGRE